jgi:hypothetical protein
MIQQRRAIFEASDARSTLTRASRCLLEASASIAPRDLSRGKTRERKLGERQKRTHFNYPSGGLI